MLSLSIASSTCAYSAFEEMLKEEITVAWQTDGGVTISKDRPESFNSCKTFDFTKGETVSVTADEFLVSTERHTIEVKNRHNFWGKGVTIKYNLRGDANTTDNMYLHSNLEPKKWSRINLIEHCPSYSGGLRRLLCDHSRKVAESIGKVISVQLHAIGKVTCTSNFTDAELNDIQAEQLRSEKALATANAQRRAEKEYEMRVFNNCIEDRLPPQSSKEYKRSVLANCRRISEAPNLWNRIKYGFIMQ